MVAYIAVTLPPFQTPQLKQRLFGPCSQCENLCPNPSFRIRHHQRDSYRLVAVFGKQFSFRLHEPALKAQQSRHLEFARRLPASTTDAAAIVLPEALLFDCDGVLVDTERDGHRISFNLAFSEQGLDTVWDVDLYGELLKIGGGKERMTHYFNKTGWPEAAPKDVDGRREFVASLHRRKTNLFMDLVEKGYLPLRPGVARLIDEALESGVNVAVCSTSNEKAVSAIVRVMLGSERASNIQIFAGDVVPRKKPDPAIYLLASKTLGVAPERSVVVEDSHIGLSAAKAAGMKCIVTKSGYTKDEDFTAADAVFECIGDAPLSKFDLNFAASLLTSAAKSAAF